VSLTDLTNTDSELRLEALQESILYLGRPDVLCKRVVPRENALLILVTVDWLSTVTSALGAIADNAPRAVDFVIQAQVETLLLKMPPQAIPRADREKFVDLLLQHLHLSEERCMRTMSTISRLMKAANPTSKLVCGCSDTS
jgi:hypothetical protein